MGSNYTMTALGFMEHVAQLYRLSREARFYHPNVLRGRPHSVKLQWN